MKILRITTKDTLPIRKQMLHEDYKSAECHYEDDDSDGSFHLGCFVEKKLVSVASFYFEKHPDIPVEHQYQLRGMATLPEFQKAGFGHALLNVAFPIIKQNFCNLIWCNTRTTAKHFYEKAGFSARADVFDVEGIGEHQLMIMEIS